MRLYPTPAAAMRPEGWSDLPPDLLREIAGHLHVAGDFVCFNAVCKPWRNSRDLLSHKTARATANQFLPWLLVPTESSSPLKLRCVFSKSSYRVLPPPYPCRMNWVCSADGTTVQYLTVQQLCPTLHDPITGAVTNLPLFPRYMPWEENPRGIVYGDGTTLLYHISRLAVNGGWARIQAALHRPGDENWTLVDKTFEATGKLQDKFCTAYHGGRIFVTAEASICHVIMPDGGSEMQVPRTWMPGEHKSTCEHYSYFLESHGDLLWVSVQVLWSYWSCLFNQGRRLLLSVHALEEAPVPEKMRWVRKEACYLTDRVLFLGSPSSFVVDASLLDGQVGCTYFVNGSSRAFLGPAEQFGMFRYNFIDGNTEFIERLPPECDIEKCTWFIPKPTITPIQEIKLARKLEAQKLKQHHKTAPVSSPSRIFHIERHYEHSFIVLVHNLHPKVKGSQLQFFFSKHGKVSGTEIIYHSNTKSSQGIVKMSTMHAHENDAVAALVELVFDGGRLEVILLNKRCRRRRRKAA